MCHCVIVCFFYLKVIISSFSAHSHCSSHCVIRLLFIDSLHYFTCHSGAINICELKAICLLIAIIIVVVVIITVTIIIEVY